MATMLLCSFAIAAASVVVGFPILLVPFPAIAAYFALSFYFTQNWRDYAIFGVAATLSIMWWLLKSFWFLDYEFELTLLPVYWTLSLNHALFMIALFTGISIAAVAVLLINKPEMVHIIPGVLASQAGLLASLEQLLYEQGEGFYSPVLVLITSALGLLFTYRFAFVITCNIVLDFSKINACPWIIQCLSWQSIWANWASSLLP